jgi:hypothetical protein
MAEKYSAPQLPVTIDNWKNVLLQWAASVPVRILASHLAVLLKAPVTQPPGMFSLLEDVSQWCRKPDDSLRWKIFEQAKVAGFGTPAGALALSLFWSQGSMSPEGAEPIYPDPTISSNMLQSALLMFVLGLADNPPESTNRFFGLWTTIEIQ